MLDESDLPDHCFNEIPWARSIDQSHSTLFSMAENALCNHKNAVLSLISLRIVTYTGQTVH